MNIMLAVSLLNLLLGVLCMVIISKQKHIRQLLSPGRQPFDPLLWFSMLLAALGVLSAIHFNPVFMLLSIVAGLVWLWRVTRYPMRVLGNFSGRALFSMGLMLVLGAIGGIIFDKLRFGSDFSLPQTVLIVLFTLSILFLMIQRAILLAIQLYLWAFIYEHREKGGNSAFKPVLLGLLTAYFGLLYTVWRATKYAKAVDKPVA